jgi:LAGLIDADG endonuclease
LRFYLTQHIKDEQLLKSFITFFECGKIFKSSAEKLSGVFTIQKLSDILEKLIPFFKKYPIFGLKALDFNDFCTLTNLINKKTHLTLKNLEDIKYIKKGMNRNRVLFTLLPTKSYLNTLQAIKLDMFLISFFHY